MIKQGLIVLLISAVIKQISHAFFLGVVAGIIISVVIGYKCTISYLQSQSSAELNINTFVAELQTIVHPIKIKKKHYLNKFSAIAENLTLKQDKCTDLQVGKLYRKRYLKRIDAYSSLMESLKDYESEHGRQLTDLEVRGFTLEQQIQYSSNEELDKLAMICDWKFQEGQSLLLPTWKEFQKVIHRIGVSHSELAKCFISGVGDQMVLLKKEYLKEVEELRKARRKLKHQNTEAFSHMHKIKQEYDLLDKEFQREKSIYDDMLKKRDDPAQLIKQEAKTKLAQANEQTSRHKLQDSRASVKEVQEQVAKFNKELEEFITKYEEQRLVYLKQGLNQTLISYEDLSIQIKQQISTLIIIMDKNENIIYPRELPVQHCSPKTFTKMIESGEIEQLNLNDKLRMCQKHTDHLLEQWQLVQRYGEEQEALFKELTRIFTVHQQYYNKDFQLKSLETDIKSQGQTIKILVKAIDHAFAGIRDVYKVFYEILEKKRQTIALQRLDATIGKQLEEQAMSHIKKINTIYKDEKAIDKYKDPQNLTVKVKTQHFFQEVKSNMSSIQSFGKFIGTVGQTINKINKLSTLTEEELKQSQESLAMEQATIIQLQGYTLKGLEEQINKHKVSVNKFKRQFLGDLVKFSCKLCNNFRQIIDEMQQNIQNIVHPTEQVDILQDQPEQEIVFQEVEEDKDVVIQNTITKFLKICFNEWKESEYFSYKIKKSLYKTFNKKRTSLLSEIEILKFQMVGDPPVISNLEPQRQDIEEFLCDFDMSFRGKVFMTLQTNLIINWPKENYAQVPVEIKICMSTFTSRIRLCMVPGYMGKSWMALIGQPVLNLDIQVTVLQKYQLGQIPQAEPLMRELLMNKIKLMTYPNKVTIPLPITKKKQANQ